MRVRCKALKRLIFMKVRRAARLALSPQFFSGWQYSSDAKPSSVPTFRYDKVLNQTLSAGVSQQTDFGLNAKFSYLLSQTEYKPLAGPYYEGRPVVEFTQSLWRNFFGRETRAGVDASRFSNQAKKFGESFKSQTILLDAEAAYWRLVLARESVQISKDAVERASRLETWSRNRVRLHLSDRSEGLQTTATLRLRELELRTAQDEERSASLAFNGARGLVSNQVEENLQKLTPEMIASFRVPERAKDRSDVLAADRMAKAGKANAELAREKTRPTLEAYGSYAYNSQSSEYSKAVSDSWGNDRPTQMIGVRLSLPMDYSLAHNVQQGWAKEAYAADLLLQRKRLEQERDWSDLSQRFTQAKERLALAEQLTQTQNEKYNYERERQLRGRSTLLQVLTFEADLQGAQYNRLRVVGELMQIVAQMKLYGVNYESR